MKKSKTVTLALPVLPLRNMVVLPGFVVPVEIGRSSSVRLIQEATKSSPTHILLAVQKDPHQEEPQASDLESTAVEAEVLKVVRLSEGRYTAVLRAVNRKTLGLADDDSGYLSAVSVDVEETNGDTTESQALAIAVKEQAKKLLVLSKAVPADTAKLLEGVTTPTAVADLATAVLELDHKEQLQVLGELDVQARLKFVIEKLQHRVQVLEVKEKIDTHVRDEISASQREVVLRQRLKAIKEELGEEDDSAEFDEYEEKLKAANMPPDVLKVAKKQLERLKMVGQQSPEHTVTRNYLEWLLDLPWDVRSVDEVDIPAARKILDDDHFGLEKIKKRVLEFLAVRKLKPNKRAPILCLVGPPGVGKTSLGRSVAKALGRKFVRISLGGVRDEAEIRGHRRTYIGALPGRIVQGLKKAGTKNPIFMLDEMDKMSADFRGDPASAMLEVLDPEQNNTFSDHYLEVPFDLSEVIFIATANDLSPVPAPLRDRMEVLHLSSYTREEKTQIAEKYLVPKQLEEHGIASTQLTFDKDALHVIIDHYVREAGVRNLEREIGSVIRGVAVKVAEGTGHQVTLTKEEIVGYLGPERYEDDNAEKAMEPGIGTGLAWTPVGGDILFVEITKMVGKGKLVLTGQLGDVMKESAQAALSYVRAHSAQLGIADDVFEKNDIHLHVPQGGVPKDGPSAGNVILTSLVSLLTGRKVRGDVAMTGEISLRGHVMPVGGIKEKVLAAHRAGIKHIILPERNGKDLIDVPDEVKKELTFHLVKRVEETLKIALEEQSVDVPSGDPLDFIPPAGTPLSGGTPIVHV